ncbi:hypothetical protein BH10BAC3_BH10BAC3_30360 [soil metagenome]
MPIQYIQDDSGQTTAVIIPIAEWKDITSRHQDLRELESKPVTYKKMKPSDFAGTLSPEGYKAINNHIEHARKEWDRDF